MNTPAQGRRPHSIWPSTLLVAALVLLNACTAGPPEAAKPVAAMIIGESAKQALLTEQVSTRSHASATRQAYAIYNSTMQRAQDKDGRVSARLAARAGQLLARALSRIERSRATDKRQAAGLHENVVDGVNALMEAWQKQGQVSEGDVELIKQLGEQVRTIIRSKAAEAAEPNAEEALDAD